VSPGSLGVPRVSSRFLGFPRDSQGSPRGTGVRKGSPGYRGPPGYSEVPRGTKRYPEVPRGTPGYLKVPRGVLWGHPGYPGDAPVSREVNMYRMAFAMFVREPEALEVVKCVV
jgi:hypothetical protein